MSIETARGEGRGRAALGGVLALSALLNGWGLWNLGYGNAYYAAAVRSMLSSWHNLLYASFDAGGFVSIDKPPLGFWLQAASARLFGFSGVALMLPEAAAGVASVALLYHLVARVWGRSAGLAAALLLALSPISVVASRSNIVDGVLVLVLLLAALAVSRAARTGRLRWLLLGAVLVGLGFNVKMLEAYLVVPALALVYLVAAPVRRPRRLAHLGAAAAVLVTASLCWVVAVDLTPPAQRPYVGSSAGNSELNLALGYNGWSRVSGSPYRGRFGGADAAAPRRPATTGGLELSAFSSRETGPPGPLRLFRQPLGSQTGWLLPLALAGLVAAAVRRRWGRPFDARQRSLLLWGAWLLGAGAFFSVASTVHAYYLAVLAPSIAALAGIGAAVLVREAAARTRVAWLLPAALAGSAAEAASVLADFPGWSRWLTPLVVSAAMAAALLVVVARRRSAAARWAEGLAMACGAAALLAAPATWTGYTVTSRVPAALPIAGPLPAGQAAFFRRFATGGAAPVAFGGVDRGLLRYLEANQGSAAYLMATLAAMSAAPYMLASDRPAMALGGFMGGDRIVDPDRLATLVAHGEVRFFLLRGPGGAGPLLGRAFAGFMAGGVNADLVGWVTANCGTVPRTEWSTASAGRAGAASGMQLYDCATDPDTGMTLGGG